ncbi:hypothetical protein HZS_3196 [Henneguya salminicola]|nr:hypothetical protein HZS_3196 [Henneguya salminicola]
MDPIHYASDIEEEDNITKRKKRDDISFEKTTQKAADHYATLLKQSLFIDEYDKHERKSHMYHFLSMDAVYNLINIQVLEA